MDPGTRVAPAKKRDRSTVPALAFIVACVLAAYGFKQGSALLMWILPSILVGGALVYAFIAGRGKGETDGSS